MVDEKCDYCKPFDGQYFCLAESKPRKFDEFAWAEDYPECDSNFYRGCACYIYENLPKIKEIRNIKSSFGYNFGDDVDEL